MTRSRSRSARLHARATLVLAFVSIAAIGLLAAQDPAGTATKPAPDPIEAAERALVDGDASSAIAALDRLLSQAPERAAEVRLLRAAARVRAKDLAGALADLEAVASDPRPSPLALKAAQRRADVLALLHREEEAAAAAANVVAVLRGSTRRAEIARFYLRTARELLHPKQDVARVVAPDVAAGLSLLQKLSELGVLGKEFPETAEVQLEMLRAESTLGQDADARAARAAKFLAEFADDANAPEAMFLLGDARAAKDDRFGARDAWTELAEKHARSSFAPQALERILGLFADPSVFAPIGVKVAEEAAEKLAAGWPGDERAGEALLRLADLQLRHEEFRPRGLATLDRVARQFEKRAAFARFTSAQHRASDGDLEGALADLRKLLAENGADPLARSAQPRLLDLLWNDAAAAAEAASQLAQTPKSDDARRAAWIARARARLEEFAERAPLDPRSAELELVRAELLVSEKKTDEAIAAFRAAADRFTGQAEGHRAQFRLAELLCDPKGDFEAGIAAFRKVGGELAGLAGGRIHALQSPELRLKSERAFRVAEPAVVTLETRNLEKVDVSLYRVKLADVFLADGTLADLTKLEVALLSPDRSFEVAVTGKTRFAPNSQPIAVDELKDEGAFVVVARAGMQEARAVVMKSDLDVVTIATRRALTVLATNAATGASLDAAAARASLDRRLLERGAFPVDGIAGSELQVFLGDKADGNGGALTRAMVNGLALAPRPQRTAWLSPDRTTVRPGETVRVLGFLRGPGAAANGALGVIPADGCRIEWRDVTVDRLLASRPLQLSASGRFVDSLVLDPALRDAHSIVARVLSAEENGDRELASTVVTLVTAIASDVNLALELPEHPVVAGAGTTVLLRVTDYAGEPLAGHSVTTTIGATAPVTAKTDSMGRVFVEVPARLTRMPGFISIRASSPESNASTGASLLVVHDAATVALDGPVAGGAPGVAGEETEIRLVATAPDGSPRAVEVTARAHRLDPLEPGDASDATGKVTTGADGKGAWRFVPARAGEWFVTLEWLDASGMPARESTIISVAGDGDAIPVHLIPETTTPRPGQALLVRVHSELDAGPATLVLHSRGFESAQAVQLAKGLNRFTVPIPDAGWRELHLTLVAARGARVESPTVSLTPALGLDVTLDAPAAAVRAGASIRARVGVRAGESAIAGADVAFVLVGEPHQWDGVAGSGAPLEALQPREPNPSASFVAIAHSASFAPPSSASALDPTLQTALDEIARVALNETAAVMVRPLDVNQWVDERRSVAEAADAVGYGGAGGFAARKAGGKYKAGGAITPGGGRGPTSSTEPLPFHPAPILWRPDLVSDAGGATEIEFGAPAIPGRYRLFAFVSHGGSAFGRAVKTITVAEPIETRIHAPAALARGDTASVRVLVAETAGAAAKVAIDVKDGDTTLAARTVELPSHGAADIALPLAALSPGAHDLLVKVNDAEHRVRLTVGDGRLATVATVSGVASGERAIELPAAALEPGDVLVHLDASSRALLLSLAEEPATDDDPRDLETAILRLWASAEAAIAAGDHAAAAPRKAEVMTAARARLAHVLAFLPALDVGQILQNPEVATCDPTRLPLLLHVLGRARTAGLPVEPAVIDALAASANGRLKSANDPAERLWLAFGASAAAPPEFAHLNRLFREKDALEARALALLALLLNAAGRPDETAATLATLATRVGADGQGAGDREPATPLSAAEEVTALVVRAAAAGGSKDEAFARAQGFLWQHRAGRSFRSLATGILLGVATASPAVESNSTRVRVARDSSSTSSEERTLEGDFASASITLPAAAIGDTRALTISASGGPAVLFSIERRGRGDAAPSGPTPITIERRVNRASARRDGAWFPVGDTILEDDARDRRPRLTTTPALDRQIGVSLIVRFNDAPVGEHWIHEAIPPGLGLVADSVGGASDVVVDADGLWMRVPRTRAIDNSRWVSYALAPRVPGAFTFGAARARLGRAGPDALVTATGATALTPPAPDADPDADIAPTPDEAYRAGAAAIDRKDFRRARELLLPLAKLRLKADPARETLRLLLVASVEEKSDADTVAFFELLKERDPSFVVQFGAMSEVGRAYRQLREFERGRQVFRAIAEATFLEEAQVVGRLEATGRQRAAFAAMQRLFDDAPDSSEVATTRFAFAQHLWSLGKTAPPKTDVPEQMTSGELLDRARRTLLRWLAEDKDAADADEALLTLANVELDRKDHSAARAFAATGRKAFPSGDLRFTWVWVDAYAALAMRDLDGALAAANVLVDQASRSDDAREQGLGAAGRLMRAQIRHARGELDLARADYAAVRDRFPDAERSLSWLTQSGLVAPEVIRARGGEPLRLKVDVRGAAERVEVRAYPVDLRRLLLEHKGLAGLADVRLAGVKPAKTFDAPLPEAMPGALKSVTTQLDLEGRGAWLLLVRAGDLGARVLAVRSDLAIEVEAGGELRVHATDAARGVVKEDVAITFIPEGGNPITTAKTDLRGICAAPADTGPVAIVAEWNGNYAFERSAGALTAGVAGQSVNKAEFEKAKSEDMERDKAFDQLLDSQKRYDAAWKSNTNRAQQGVEVERAKK